MLAASPVGTPGIGSSRVVIGTPCERHLSSSAMSLGDLVTWYSCRPCMSRRGRGSQTYYRWRNQFGGGLKANDAKRLKDLEPQNSHGPPTHGVARGSIRARPAVRRVFGATAAIAWLRTASLAARPAGSGR